ncbi:N-(5'-phosphoribosyl)anthranilate isomerase [Anatilimnocola sp. NA78]|uniref:phosphoribosylanthranilate isomerase n=1 Tax=Anatilimnocola sp. NA78 TaxID=3415683 RepID=UPI003CE55F5F
MFRIKICGITNTVDALQAIDAGADALGLNFYSRSPRFVAGMQAAEISRQVRATTAGSRASLVGVFVNEEEPALRAVHATAQLNAWQLHGDETAEFLQAIAAKPDTPPLIRAYRCKENDLVAISRDLFHGQKLGALPSAVLVDAYAPNAFGGTGQVVDWHAVRNERGQLFSLPLILAGGLTPENVAEAIRTARPDAVDVASGVESSPGKKDPAKVRDFIAAAKAAFAEIFPQ